VEVVESASLESCTSEIEEVTVKINGKKVALIDTPGFDDTNKSDTEILTLITNYLESKCVVLMPSIDSPMN
jgi:predicted GTPase